MYLFTFCFLPARYAIRAIFDDMVTEAQMFVSNMAYGM
jgi:hypothetical protein